jgi:hypothetical protein
VGSKGTKVEGSEVEDGGMEYGGETKDLKEHSVGNRESWDWTCKQARVSFGKGALNWFCSMRCLNSNIISRNSA